MAPDSKFAGSHPVRAASGVLTDDGGWGVGWGGEADYRQSEQLFNEHRDLFLRRSFPLKTVEAVSRSI